MVSRLAFALSLLPAVALATPAPRLLHHGASEPHVAPHPPLPPGASLPLSASPIDVSEIVYDVTLEPTTGVTSGTVTVTASSASTPITGLLLYMDPGLNVTEATVPGGSVSVVEQEQFGYRYVSLTLSPAVPVGNVATVTVSFAGTLSCQEDQGRQHCDLSGEMSYVLQGSAIPGIYDQTQVGGYHAWPATRRLTLRLPQGVGAIATGELEAESVDNGLAVRTWFTPGYASVGGYLAILGDLTFAPAASGPPNITLVHAATSPAFVPQMASWMNTILPFLEQSVGAPLPFAELAVVKLPLGYTFPGTAGHGITLLSESYGSFGEAYFEETLAHENAHQWWGVLVSPNDVALTRWLTEGLATQAQIDYAAHTFALDLREAFIARRFREHQLLLRYHTDPALIPPLVVGSAAATPVGPVDYTVWAYIKSSATLEHLRTIVGDAAYAEGLKSYVAACQKADCGSQDFLAAIAQASGVPLSTFASQWVYDTSYRELTIGFSQTASANGVEVTVIPEGGAGLVVPLELWLTLESGERVRRSVVLPASGDAVVVDAPSTVRSVRPNPRHDAVIWSRSAVAGDVDFDGEVDGFDLLHCARLVGMDTGLYQEGGEGLWQMNLDFDPRCDAVFDGQLTDVDLDPIKTTFGTLKEGS